MMKELVREYIYHLRSAHGSEILASGTSEVLVIINTPKKQNEG
jgi:hypothetical protein